MINAKQEFLNAIVQVNATVLWARFRSENSALITLAPEDAMSKKSWNEFLKKLDYNYDNKFGGEYTEGAVMFSNEQWLTRVEYNGSSNWALIATPTW